MAKFGLDKKYVQQFKDNLNVEHVRQNQSGDFFALPQFDAIYRYCADKLKALAVSRLNSGDYGPKPPIEMEVPKSSRVFSRSYSVVGPNYFRTGSVLTPEDRLIYHYLAQEASALIEKSINRKRVFSNLPSAAQGGAFVSPAIQWVALRKSFEKLVRSGKYTIVLKSDISQYFFCINQHELINQLEHQGLPSELVKFAEKFLTGLTLDRSSRGILQGMYGSDIMGNGYLIAIDDLIKEENIRHFRYVDDIYILFKSIDELRSFFPKFVDRLNKYDLSLNESKTFITLPSRLLREESELDKAIVLAKAEASEKLTGYEEIEVDSGPYGDTVTEILESPPDDKEVELQSTLAVFEKLDDFKGEERHRAESFCLSFFRRAGDPVAVSYVVGRWARHPDRAREYAIYLNRFAVNKKHGILIDEMIAKHADVMIDYQWAWAAIPMMKLKSVSEKLYSILYSMVKDGSRHEVVRSLLTYIVCAHGSAQKKKEIRELYSQSPLLVQLSIIHSSRHFTGGERSALIKTAEAHGDLQALMCEALRVEAKGAALKGAD